MPLRNGVMMALGGALLYGVFWMALRNPLQRSQLVSQGGNDCEFMQHFGEVHGNPPT
ncbi:MAG: hypothetical protein HGB32_13075 [Geobacteraceae bacterium]|nr:hypothetical protein [Geobacteraceae bacterium]